MASRALDDVLTLAPFRRIYGSERDFGLLADTYFATPDRSTTTPIGEGEPAMPKVIPMPNRTHFEAALAQWLEDTTFDSLPGDMKEHRSFNQLVEQGMRAVPLIAASLRRNPSFLFLALEEIFNDNPVPDEACGNLQATVTAWLQWLQR